jgi:hypothetical protein
MTLHFAQRGLTDALTFIDLLSPNPNISSARPLVNGGILGCAPNLRQGPPCTPSFPNRSPDRALLFVPSFDLMQSFDYATPCQVIGRKRDCNLVAWNEADRTQPQLIVQAGRHHMAVVELYAPCSVRPRLEHLAFYPDVVFFLCQSTNRTDCCLVVIPFHCLISALNR